MYFLFSKLLLIFILPFTWAITCLIAALMLKNPRLKKRFFVSAAVILLVFSDPLLFNWYVKHWDFAPAKLKNNQPYSCAIVLGGFSSGDRNGDGFFNGAADRFIQGLKLITTGKVSHILITGGSGALIGDKFRESAWVEKQLKEFKVADTCILIENDSRNTLENAAFSKALLIKDHLPPPYILVTSAFHMRRSFMIFKKARLDVIPYPCNYIAGKGKFIATDLLPDASVLAGWSIYSKELVGTVTNYFK